jgi:hypothetical protein
MYFANHCDAGLLCDSDARWSTCHSEHACDGVRVYAVLTFLCLIFSFCFCMLLHVDRDLNTVRISNLFPFLGLLFSLISQDVRTHTSGILLNVVSEVLFTNYW